VRNPDNIGAAAELAGGTGLFTGAASMDLQKAIRDLYEEKERIGADAELLGIAPNRGEFLGQFTS
jgi:hypothetical protein